LSYNNTAKFLQQRSKKDVMCLSGPVNDPAVICGVLAMTTIQALLDNHPVARSSHLSVRRKTAPTTSCCKATLAGYLSMYLSSDGITDIQDATVEQYENV
jgi:hypothetical protein